MIINELSENIFYIENAFPQAKDFIDNVEKFDQDPNTYSVIPQWKDWHDSIPVQDEHGFWRLILDDFSKGKEKLFDWDRSLTNNNQMWPRPNIELDQIHALIEPTINMLHEPYVKILDFWSEKTGNPKLEYISKNYFLRKYNVGGNIGPHVDKNVNNPANTMDWSVLFYLSGDYTGGEIVFPDLDITLKPAAGSALIFPCNKVHVAEPVTGGDKYYIFMVIHSELGYSSALNEEYHEMNRLILKHKNMLDHPLLTNRWPGPEQLMCMNCKKMFKVPSYITDELDKCPDCNPEYYHEVNCACTLCMPG